MTTALTLDQVSVLALCSVSTDVETRRKDQDLEQRLEKGLKLRTDTVFTHHTLNIIGY